jgi:hypothetical protein
VACTRSTTRDVGSCVGWLHSTDNLTYSVCFKLHKVWTVNVWCDVTAMHGIVNCPYRKYSNLFRILSFMRYLVVMADEGWVILCSLPTKWRIPIEKIISHQLNHDIGRTQEYISTLTAYTSFLLSFPIVHPNSILRYLNIMRLAQNNTFRSNTHQITYKTLYFPSGFLPQHATML